MMREAFGVRSLLPLWRVGRQRCSSRGSIPATQKVRCSQLANEVRRTGTHHARGVRFNPQLEQLLAALLARDNASRLSVALPALDHEILRGGPLGDIALLNGGSHQLRK